MSEIKVEAYYRKQAHDLTNMLFDKDFLNSELTRESIEWLEEYIGFIMQSMCQTAAKMATLTAKLKEK